MKKSFFDGLFAFKLKPFLCTIVVFIAIMLVPCPETLEPQAWLMLAIFATTILAIILKVMPIGAIALIAVTITTLLVVPVEIVTDPATGATKTVYKQGAAISAALKDFSNPIIWLIVISVMISRGLIKTGLGSRIGYYFISKLGKKTLGIGYGLAISELFLSPVTPSNTARGGAIIHPIMQAISKAFNSTPEQGTSKKMGRFLALVNYHSNPITSVMFITATAPNPLIVNLVMEATNNTFRLTWGTWALAMLVPGIVAILLMPLVIYFFFPPEIKEVPDASTFAEEKIKELGKVSKSEGIMIAVFVMLLLLWAGVPAMLFGQMFAVHPTTTAFIGLSALLAFGILSWDDVLKEKSSWDTLFWFGTLIMMAGQLNKLGVAQWLSDSLQGALQTANMGTTFACAILLLVYMYAHYFFASTTAHISAMLLVFLGVGISMGADPIIFSLIMAAASSIMMTLTHYATGTSPIIFGSGYVTMGEWWKAGFIMSVVNLLIWIFIGGLWWKFLIYLDILKLEV